MAGPGQWWWEVRPHPLHGTLEVRAPDAQATIEHGAAITALVQSLVAWLSQRYDAGEPLAVAPGWRIEENRWSAARHGVEGTLADLTTGENAATSERLLALIDDLDPVAAGLGCASELAIARELAVVNDAGRQRAAAGPDGDARAATGWLADVFVPATTTGGSDAS